MAVVKMDLLVKKALLCHSYAVKCTYDLTTLMFRTVYVLVAVNTKYCPLGYDAV